MHREDDERKKGSVSRGRDHAPEFIIIRYMKLEKKNKRAEKNEDHPPYP